MLVSHRNRDRRSRGSRAVLLDFCLEGERCGRRGVERREFWRRRYESEVVGRFGPCFA